MSTNDSSTQTRGVEQIRASLERITRDFDNMITRMQMDNARIRMLSNSLPALANRVQSKPDSTAVASGLQRLIESQARQKAAGKELAAAASTFAQEVIQWVEQMKQRQQEQAREPAANQPVANRLVTAAERAAAGKKLANLAVVYSEKAKEEEQMAGPAAFLPDGVFPPDERERHKLAAKEAADIAEEMQRRAYILTNGTENNYINLVVDQYRLNDFFNNSNLNEIYAFYGKMFNDQAALNWLKLQHPAIAPSPDQVINEVGMLVLFREFGKISEEAGESPLTGQSPEESIFEKVTDIERTFEKSNNIQGDVQMRELTPAEEKTYERVDPRKSTRDAVEAAYTEDGKLYDGVTHQVIKPGTPWVMGHKEGFELRKMQVDAANRGISREEFIEEQNNPNIYQPELPKTSSRRAHEAPDHIQLPPGAAGTSHEDKY